MTCINTFNSVKSRTKGANVRTYLLRRFPTDREVYNCEIPLYELLVLKHNHQGIRQKLGILSCDFLRRIR